MSTPIFSSICVIQHGNRLDQLLVNHCEQGTINDMNERMCEIFSSAAGECNMNKNMSTKKKRSGKSGSNNNKKWFHKGCHSKKKDFHSARNKFRFCKSMNNSDALRATAREYKKSIRNAVWKYEKNFNRKLRSLKSSNPSEFWKLICTNDGNQTTSKIKLDVLSNYFSHLNKDANKYDDIEIERSSDNSVLENEFLNAPFNEDEMSHALMNLKCGKTAGPDGLLNEFFKCSRHVIG